MAWSVGEVRFLRQTPANQRGRLTSLAARQVESLAIPPARPAEDVSRMRETRQQRAPAARLRSWRCSARAWWSCWPTPTSAASSPPGRAACSGAIGCLLLQFLLMPILYMVQELTVRLGIFTGRGHGELIRDTFGPFWGWVSAAGLGIATIGRAADRILRRRRRGRAVRPAARRHAADRRDRAARRGDHRLVSPGGAGGDRGRAVRAGVLLRRLGGASRPARNARGVVDIPYAQQGLSLSGGGEYRRRGDAVDDLLPAVGDRRQEAAAGTLRRGTLGHGGRRGDHPARHGRGADRLRRDDRPRQPGRVAALGRRHEPGADAVPRHRRGQSGVRPGRAGRRHGGGDRLFPRRSPGGWAR